MRKAFYFGLILSAVLVISGCSLNENKAGKDDLGTDQPEIKDENVFSSHIKDNYSDNFEVDADVISNEVNDTKDLYAKYKHLDENDLLKYFFEGRNPQKDVVESNTVTYTDGNNVLVVSDSYMLFNSLAYETLRFAIENFSSEEDVISTGEKFSEIATKENLNFMTRAEAVQRARQFCNDISIKTSNKVELYALDHKDIKKQQEKRIKKEIIQQEKLGISPVQNPLDGYKAKEKFSDEDDCYVIFLRAEENGIPITQSSYELTTGERGMTGSTIKIILSEEGIIEAECSGIYDIVGDDDKSEQELISAEKAAKKVYEIENETLSTDNVKVVEIGLEYVPVAYNDNYSEVKLVLAWCVTNNYSTIDEKDGTESVYKRKVFINAKNGNEIK